jgi:acyl carrier protein
VSLRQDLLHTLRQNVPLLPADVTDSTSLIRSGVLDSAGLFHVALWVEQQVGGTFDVTRYDLAAEWDTMADIVSFVERHRKR